MSYDVLTPRSREDARVTFDHPASQDNRADVGDFLSEAESRAIFERCVALAGSGNQVSVEILSQRRGSLSWARNRAYLSRDVRDLSIQVRVQNQGRSGEVRISRGDDEGLREGMQVALRAMSLNAVSTEYDTRVEQIPMRPIAHPNLWSDATVQFTGARRSDTIRRILETVEAAKLLSAGEVETRSRSNSQWDTQGTARYYPSTRVAFSATVRDVKGTGSGWAGTDDFDVARIDMSAFAQTALEKCQRSINPSAIEPGRYVAILEPQAVADLVTPLIEGAMDRADSEDPMMALPFYRSPGRSKIGERVLDRRLSLTSDPMDPIGGFLPFGGPYIYNRSEWIKQGVLADLAYWISYGLGNLGIEKEMSNPLSWRLSGGAATTDEMIATTKRGLLVTRFHDVRIVHRTSLTCTGYTRDGVWLIENGKISKPVKNFRFTESPLFVLNNIEQLGEPKRVFSGTDWRAYVAPALKVNDFNFTQLGDAV